MGHRLVGTVILAVFTLTQLAWAGPASALRPQEDTNPGLQKALAPAPHSAGLEDGDFSTLRELGRIDQLIFDLRKALTPVRRFAELALQQLQGSALPEEDAAHHLFQTFMEVGDSLVNAMEPWQGRDGAPIPESGRADTWDDVTREWLGRRRVLLQRTQFDVTSHLEALRALHAAALEPPLDRYAALAFKGLESFKQRLSEYLEAPVPRGAAGLEEPAVPLARGYMATQLFKYPHQLEWLVQQIQSGDLPRIIISAGASSGEEPASIAYTLQQRGTSRTIYAIEPHDERLRDMRRHFVDGVPFTVAPGIMHPTEFTERVDELNRTMPQWRSQVMVVDTLMERAPSTLYQQASALFLNSVADLPSVDKVAIAETLIQLPPNAMLYTTRRDEQWLDFPGPGSGFLEFKTDRDSEAVAYRRMSRAEELTNLPEVLLDKDVELFSTLRAGTIAVLSHKDARWIPRDRHLLLVPRAPESRAFAITLWVDPALRDALASHLPPTVTVKSFEPGADLPTAIRAVGSSAGEGEVQLVAVSADQRDAIASMASPRVPVMVLDPGAIPEKFPDLLADLVVQARQLTGRVIDVTRGPVEHITLRGRDVVLLYAV